MATYPSSWSQPTSEPARRAREVSNTAPDPVVMRSLSTEEVAALGVETTLQRLRCSRDGLSGSEATSRLERWGPNEVSDRRRSALVEFLARFWGPIAWMIEAAFVLSLVVGRWEDASIIGVLLVMNGVVGFWEEHQAGNAISALKERLASTARVRRDGTWVVLPARALVPGDVIRVRLGDIVPADACLLNDVEVEVDQSALTGESLPVSRAGGDSLFAGSTVSRGETDALVTATGRDTYFGRTTRLVAEASTVSHFQRAVLRIGNFLDPARGGARVADRHRQPRSRRAGRNDAGVRAGGDGRGGTSRVAGGPLGDDGGRGADSGTRASDRQPSPRRRGARRHGRSVLRQDRDTHRKPFETRRRLVGGRRGPRRTPVVRRARVPRRRP